MMHLYVGENTREAHRVRECLADVGIASRLILDLEDGVIEQPALLDISFIEKISASNLAHKNVAVFAGPDQAKLAIQCIQQGAQRYFVRGGELAEIVEWAIENTQLADGSREQTDAAKKPNPSIRNFVCASAAMQKVQQLAEKSAQTDIAILITGASGSGKEVIARHIHDSSPRVAGPYVALNCAAIPESMLEAILFGHVKGAFTGASEQRVGKFQQANGGTLLLDEVTEMPLHLQAKGARCMEGLTLLLELRVDVRQDVPVRAAQLDLRDLDAQLLDHLLHGLGGRALGAPAGGLVPAGQGLAAHVARHQRLGVALAGAAIVAESKADPQGAVDAWQGAHVGQQEAHGAR